MKFHDIFNSVEMLESVSSLQKINMQLLVFEYLTVSLDKISNKKNYLKNDESF